MYGCLSTQIKINRRAKSWQKGEIVATGGKLKKKKLHKEVYNYQTNKHCTNLQSLSLGRNMHSYEMPPNNNIHKIYYFRVKC